MSILTVNCTQSPAPKVEELIKVGVPTLGGLRSRSYSTPTQTFTLTGECDTTSRGLDYSLDGVEWTEFATSCPSASFTLPITLVAGLSSIYVRARGKFTATDSSVATVRFLLPETLPLMMMVASARNDQSDLAGEGSQNTISDFATAEPITGPDFHLQSQVVGVAYSE